MHDIERTGGGVGLILTHMRISIDRARYFPAFAFGDYRALWLSAGASSAAIWAMLMARAWLALELTDSGFVVGAVTFTGMIAWLLAPFGGALADRFDRVTILRRAVLLQAALAIAMSAMAFADLIAVWQLLFFGFLNGLLWAGIELPVQSALMPNTVDRKSLMNAVLLFGLTPTAVGRLIGPLAGGPLLGGAGAGAIFAVAAALYLFEAWQLRLVKVRSTGDNAGSQLPILQEVGRSLREAIRYLGLTRDVRLIIVLVTLHCFFTMGFDAMLAIHTRETLGGGASMFGTLLMGLGIGAMMGMLALMRVSSQPARGPIFVAGGLLSSTGLVVLGLAPSFPGAMVGAIITGAGATVFVALGSTFIQEVVPDGIRGGVMSVYFMFAGGVMPIMSFGNGAAADVISTRVLITVPSIAFMVLLIAWAIFGQDLRRVSRRGTLATGDEPLVAGAVAGGGG